MRKGLYYVVLAWSALFLYACGGSGQGAGTADERLDAAAFNRKMQELPSAQVLDVRTPGEFSGGHVPGARNIDWNGPDFEKQVANLDKQTPVMVYCLSGGRSASAARLLREKGFKQVYEMQGGLMKWRAAGLAFENGTAPAAGPAGMNLADFMAGLEYPGPVLVDFYAEWCKPCKRMEPDIKAIAEEQKDRVKVWRIDTEENPALVQELGVDAIPELRIYRAGKLVWSHKGYLPGAEIRRELETH